MIQFSYANSLGIEARLKATLSKNGDDMGHKLRMLTILMGLTGVFALLVFVASRQLYTRSVRGEAKLMMGYIHTLERVYKLENKRYMHWENFYGSILQGADQCEQPEEAAEVGFFIPGCHREKSMPPRYAYRVIQEPNDRYRIEAKSGSDKAGRSFVCFVETGTELWESRQNLEYSLIESCP